MLVTDNDITCDPVAGKYLLLMKEFRLLLFIY